MDVCVKVIVLALLLLLKPLLAIFKYIVFEPVEGADIEVELILYHVPELEVAQYIVPE